MHACECNVCIRTRAYGVVPEWLLPFLGFLYAMQSLVPVDHFRNISGHLFTWLVCGSFQWRHGLLFTDCIVWDDKDNVIGFKRSHWIHLGWWSTRSPKLQLFQLLQHSHVTNCRLISSPAYFSWNMTWKYKMKQSEGSWYKIQNWYESAKLNLSLDFLCNAQFSPCWALPEYIWALIHLACLRVFSVAPWVTVYRLYRVRWQGQSDWF